MRKAFRKFHKIEVIPDRGPVYRRPVQRDVKDLLLVSGLSLFISTIAMQIPDAKAASYVASTINFGNQLPTGVLIYKCIQTARKTGFCGKQQQLGNSGYIAPVPVEYTPKGAPLEPAPQAFLYGVGSYVLWQRQKSNNNLWNSCFITIDAITGAASNCTGFSWVNNHSGDTVISINLYNDNGYIMTDGTSYSTNGIRTPPGPRESQPQFNTQSSRQFRINYKGTQSAICLNIAGTFNISPCDGKDSNDIPITKISPYTFKYGIAQNICDTTNPVCKNNGPYVSSSVMVVSGIKFSGQPDFTPVGQQSGKTDYGGRFEFAFYPQAMPPSDSPQTFNGGTLSTGVSSIDMSLVNGFNFGFKLYPNKRTICAIAHEEGGKSHYSLWDSSNPMASFGGETKYCPTPNVVTAKVSGIEKQIGCQSDGTYATNTNSEWADQYNCHGKYDTKLTCAPPASDPPPYGYTPAPIPAGAPNPWRPYSQNLGIDKQVLSNAYTWAYEDFRGTFTCDGDAPSYTLDIYDPS